MTRLPISVVTGGAGFIGSHMVELLLAEGHTVRVIDDLSGGRESNLTCLANQESLSLCIDDITSLPDDHALFDGASYVFHFAGIGDIVPSIERPTKYIDTNVLGTVRVLEAARHARVSKFVYAASSSCYGLAGTPTQEEHLIDPQYPYALSKYQGEQAVFHWNRVYGLPTNSIRIFNAYGTRVRTTGVYGAVFGVFFKQKLEGKPFTVVGDGTQRRDFVYASDVADGFLRAATTNLVGEVWNLGGGNPQSINRLVELLGGHVEYIPRRPGEPDCTWANIEKIARDLSWLPKVQFEEGVGLMLKEINHWQDAPLWDSESIGLATSTWFKYMSKGNK